MMHVFYFNDTYKRNWIKINHIFQFFGKEKLLDEFPKITVSKVTYIFVDNDSITINKLNNLKFTKPNYIMYSHYNFI